MSPPGKRDPVDRFHPPQRFLPRLVRLTYEMGGIESDPRSPLTAQQKDQSKAWNRSGVCPMIRSKETGFTGDKDISARVLHGLMISDRGEGFCMRISGRDVTPLLNR